MIWSNAFWYIHSWCIAEKIAHCGLRGTPPNLHHLSGHYQCAKWKWSISFGTSVQGYVLGPIMLVFIICEQWLWEIPYADYPFRPC